MFNECDRVIVKVSVMADIGTVCHARLAWCCSKYFNDVRAENELDRMDVMVLDFMSFCGYPSIEACAVALQCCQIGEASEYARFYGRNGVGI